MPKIVDHEKQKEKVAEAAWRLIRRDGMEGASVRRIAEEAGISAGSMRHYFSTQSELFAFAMKLVSQRVQHRLQSISFTGNPFADAQALLYELLPLDEEKRAEMEVWLVFNIKALSDSSLRPLSAQVYQEMKHGITLIVDALIRYGIAKEDLNREAEIEILYALIDGLALHGIMQAEQLPPEAVKGIVLHHLHSICKER